MYSLSQIEKQLERLKSAKGKSVTMHTSMRKIGKTEGGAEALLSLLIQYLGGKNHNSQERQRGNIGLMKKFPMCPCIL